MPTAAPRKAGNAPFAVSSQSALARELGVSRSAVSDWVRLPGFPVADDGTFPVAKVIEWRVRRELEGAEGDDLREQKLKAEIAKLREDARAKQLKNDLLEGELCYMDEATLYLNENASLVRSRLEQWPDEATASVPSDVRPIVRESLRSCAHHLLTELSRPFEPSSDVEELP